MVLEGVFLNVDGGYGNVRNRTIYFLLDILDDEDRVKFINYLKDTDNRRYNEFLELIEWNI